MNYEIYSPTDSRIFSASSDETIMSALRAADIDHHHSCQGRAKCSTCRITVLDGLDNCLPRNHREQAIATKLGFPPEIRLACQTKICGNIIIKRLVIDDVDVGLIQSATSNHSSQSTGKEMNCAILFTDIEKFTPFVEAVPAYDVVHVLNRYYHEMNDAIVKNRGIISDVAGDGILSLFGALDENPFAVGDALETFREMLARLKKFNVYTTHMYNRSFTIRAGIHFGRVIVGKLDVGSMKKIAAYGDSVNMASRIENANKKFGTPLLISEAAFSQIQKIVALRKKYKHQLKGKSGKHTLYEVKLNS